VAHARVVMLVAKTIDFDARVRRSARSLVRHGYEVTVGCVAADGRATTTDDEEGYRVVAVPVIRAKTKESLRKVRAERRQLALRLTDAAPTAAERRKLAELEAAEAELSRRLERQRRGVADKGIRKAWTRLIRDQRPDVIHVHDHHGLATAFAARAPGTAVVYDAHEHVLGKDLKPARRPAITAYLRRHAPRADAVVTVGAAIADMLVRELELPARPIVVHNAPSLVSRPAPYALREAIAVEATTPLLVYTGSVTGRRRLSTVMQAMSELPDVHFALILLEENPEVAAMASSLGVGERVHFPPPVPHDSLLALIRDAHAGVHPLDRYGNGDVALPNKLFEYLHAGLPMVVSDSPEMAAFVSEHRLGEVAKVDDPAAWAAAIRQVLAHPARYRAGAEERESLRREWAWESGELALLELYRRLAPKHHPRPSRRR
jgi:glycosyltransferase involved in cell wall biosynthesis